MNKKNEKFSKICGTATIGARGQVVIPAKVRKLFNIKSGDELIVFADPSKNMVGFIPADHFIKFISETSKIIDVLKSKKAKSKGKK